MPTRASQRPCPSAPSPCRCAPCTAFALRCLPAVQGQPGGGAHHRRAGALRDRLAPRRLLGRARAAAWGSAAGRSPARRAGMHGPVVHHGAAARAQVSSPPRVLLWWGMPGPAGCLCIAAAPCARRPRPGLTAGGRRPSVAGQAVRCYQNGAASRLQPPACPQKLGPSRRGVRRGRLPAHAPHPAARAGPRGAAAAVERAAGHGHHAHLGGCGDRQARLAAQGGQPWLGRAGAVRLRFSPRPKQHSKEPGKGKLHPKRE